jgi:hypothetical protein
MIIKNGTDNLNEKMSQREFFEGKTSERIEAEKNNNRLNNRYDNFLNLSLNYHSN